NVDEADDQPGEAHRRHPAAHLHADHAAQRAVRLRAYACAGDRSCEESGKPQVPPEKVRLLACYRRRPGRLGLVRTSDRAVAVAADAPAPTAGRPAGQPIVARDRAITV